MSQEIIYTTLLAPVVSEKSTRLAEESNQVVFKVAINATKPQIKRAVETLFDVKVDSVRTLVSKGKRKNFGRRQGQRSDWKKAYVRLLDGQVLDLEAKI